MGTAEKSSKAEDDESEGRVKSRMVVDETYIHIGDADDKDAGVIEKDHTRNRIDRFTGGVIGSALFTTRPIWQADHKKATVHIHFLIKKASRREVGLALFLLKDLWQGKIAIGGEAGSGRGTLSGMEATLRCGGKTYKLNEAGKVVSGDADELSKCAEEFALDASLSEEAE